VSPPEERRPGGIEDSEDGSHTGGDGKQDGADGARDDRGWFRRLDLFLSRHRKTFVAAIVLSIVGQVLLGLIPLIQSVVVDDAVIDDRRPLGPWLALMVGVGVVSYAVNLARRYLGARVSLDVQNDMRIAIHRHLQHLDATRHDQLSTGDVMSRATADVTLVQMFLNQVPMVAANLAFLLVALVVMVSLSPMLTLVVAVCVPLFAYLAVRFRNRVFPASWNDQRLSGEVAGVVDETVSGVRVVKAFGQERREQDLLVDSARDLYGSRMRTARLTAKFGATLQAIPNLGQVGVLAVGGWLALRGEVTLGTFSAFSSYLVQLVAPVRLLSGVMATSQQARAGAERVFELLDLPAAVADRPGAEPLPRPNGRIDLDRVTFAYEGGEPVVRDLSLTVEPGERVALVGGSGSGKTTVANLMARVYDPDAGTVSIDGHDVRDVTIESVRRAVGVVAEEAFLFGTTIRENVAFAKPDATADEVEQAARMAQAHRFVSALPEGYDTMVGERGFTLSGGQRQRLALARAALANPAVLVLDDATSAVDSRTEAAIHASFDEVVAGRTTILIAHRASTLRLADRVVVLDRGSIAAEGTHEGLLRTSPLYRELLTGPDDLRAEDRRGEGGNGNGKGAGNGNGHDRSDEVTAVDPDAWPDDASRDGAARTNSYAAEMLSLATVRTGPGAGMGGNLGAGAALVTATEDLLDRVDALPPVRDEPGVDVDALVAEDLAAAADDPVREPTRGVGAGGDAPAGEGRSGLFRRVVRPFRKALAVGVALVAFDALTTLVGPLMIRHGIDDGVVLGREGVLWATCAVFLAVQLASWANAMTMQLHTARIAERVMFGLRARAFAQLQRLSLDFYDREMGGRIMTRMTTDVEALAQLLQQGLVTAVANLLTCLGVVVVLVVLDARLALAALAVLPVLILATAVFRRASGRAYLVARERISAVNADMQESLSGVRVTQAYVRQDRNEARFAELSTGYRDARMRGMVLVSRYFPFLQLLTAIAKAITLLVGASLIGDGRLTEGVLVAFLVYLDQFFSPIQQLSMVFDQWVQAGVSLGRIDELLHEPTGTPAAEDPVVLPDVRGDLRFEHVRFAYASTGLEALRGVDMHVRPGEVVALVGPTGAGKSTFVKVAARFYDVTGGRVLVDGVPLPSLDLPSYRRHLGYVPQEPFLFSGTIRSNIAYGRPDATDLEVEEAARAVGAHAFVAGLPDGYLTAVTERGRSLSAGQRQLLCLARAQLVDPRILILDEATANLDLATEAQVQRAMGLVARGRTTLLIAHRLQTARAADRIVVVDDGMLVEDGTHDELVAAGGRYAELWSAFTESAVDAPAGTDGSGRQAACR
jgi:ABC-type multidrug transport system fused ATPase/permease subunit